MKIIKLLNSLKLPAILYCLLAWVNPSEAQICSATNSYVCPTGGYFTGVSFKNSAGTTFGVTGMNCSSLGGNGSSNNLMTSGAVMDLIPGEKISMTIDNNATYSDYCGVWIDMNGDNTFTASECISTAAAPFGSIPTNSSITKTLTLPCVAVKGGKVIMRVRCSYYTFTPSQGCGNLATYGNILDFEVNIKPVSPPVADFTVPTGPNFVKTPINFNSTTTSSAYNQTWTFTSGNTIVGSGTKGKASWNATGYYDVKLKQEYCGLADSVTKAVKIENPTAAPVADFIAASNQIEIWYSTQMSDLSTNGPTTWNWEVISPDGLTKNLYYTQNPTVQFTQEGWWDVCLSSSNGIGPSSKVCKSRYVECIPPGEFYMGPSKIATNQGGIIYDNGGKDANYGNNRKTAIDYFKIFPCGAKEIRFNFRQLKLAVGDGGDRLRIFDGQDESGKELTPAGGITGVNQTFFRSQVFKAYSGAMYMTFESNSSTADSGFIGVWDSELLPVTNPKSGFTTDYTTVGVGTAVTYNSAVTKAQGNVTYDWMIDGNNNMGNMSSFTNTFNTDGTYQVCLIASVCNGTDTFCKNITAITPSTPVFVDFVSSNQRPKTGETVSFSTKTDWASTFDWSIYPATFSYVGGTNSNSRNPKIVFTSGGAYTFTLRAWNAAGTRVLTESKVIKTKYVIAVKYCTPTTDMLSSDVAISKVELLQDSVSLLENTSPVGIESYRDYSGDFNNNLSFGSYYSVILTRRTNSNQANFKAWIDYNIDGVFSDNEMILNSGTISGTKANAKFRVPDLKDCFEGVTKMRVAVSYGSFSNTACGVNIVGEFEDYGITLKNDGRPPVISLLGDAVIRVEKSAIGCWTEVASKTYKAIDPTEGDLTSSVVVTTDLDCTIPGTYYAAFNVTDAAGNTATEVTRKIIVVLDKTAPSLTLLSKDTFLIEQCDVVTIPGAVATDLTDGNLTSNIIVSGNVDNSTVGDYKVTYSVSDAQGNLATKVRLVRVVDTKRPGIYSRGKRIVNNTIVPIQIGSLFVDDVTSFDTCNGSTSVNKVPGYNNMVNTLIRATYPMTYYSTDIHGNKAVEDGYTINYKVDDYIAPEITLNTSDTVVHDVNNYYSSQAVSVYDNFYASSKISIEKKGKVNPFVLGLYVEQFTATDESGNTVTKNRYVKVVDRIAPSIITTAVNVCAGTPFWAMSEVAVEDNYYSNDELFPLVKIHSHNVNIWVAGVYYINYEVSDPSGNKSQIMMRPVFVQYPPDCDNSFTSIQNMPLNKQVVISPNPTEGKVKFEYAMNNSEPVQIEIMNMLGSKIATLVAAGGFGTESFDFSNYASGTYLVRVTNKGQSFTQKIVVSH
jgi:plastocyanin